MDRKKLFYKLLELLKGSKREEKINKMVEAVFERVATVPASSKVNYHCCYEGGLLDHTNLVTLKMLADRKFYLSPLHSIIIVGLFHDLGKIGNQKEYFYVEAEDWKKQRGMPYEIPDNMKKLPHAARSIHILNRFNIHLTEAEFQAILYHNLLPEDRAAIRYHETPLLHILHQADVWACWIFEKAYNQDIEIFKKLIKVLEQEVKDARLK